MLLIACPSGLCLWIKKHKHKPLGQAITDVFGQIIIKVPYLFNSYVVHIILLGQLFGTNFSWNIRGKFWVPCYHSGIFCPSLCYFSRRRFWIGIFCQKIEQTQTGGIWRIKLKIEFIKSVAPTIIPNNNFVPANYSGW